MIVGTRVEERIPLSRGKEKGWNNVISFSATIDVIALVMNKVEEFIKEPNKKENKRLANQIIL